MKVHQILALGAAALFGISSAKADTVIHITGSTAFRGATVTAITNVLGGAAAVKSAFQTSSGASATASGRCVIQGSVASIPAAGVVTVKCSWSGSTGGIKTVVQNIDVTTWMSITNLGAAGSPNGLADGAISYSLDTGTFSGETPKADVCMMDSSQAATGFTSTLLTETRVGVIPFEFIANNYSPGADPGITNMTSLLYQAIASGGAPLSQFSGLAADSGIAVYAVGRDFDSGTRLSVMAETGVGVFGSVQHVQAVASGALGANGSSITTLQLYPAETVLGQSFPIGNSGYPSGGTLADFLATPGTQTANTTSGVPAGQVLGFGPGHCIGYVGRADAVRATRKTNIATNTARRLKWNGLQIWNDPVAANGTPASYNDNLITEGLYQLWEYEYLGYRASLASTNANGKAVADAIATRIINVDAAGSGNGIALSAMHVSKAVEGGIIVHN